MAYSIALQSCRFAPRFSIFGHSCHWIWGFIHDVNAYSSLSTQTRNSENHPHVNKVSLYLERARLIDLIRLHLWSNNTDSLISLLNDPAMDSFVVTNALKSAPSPDSALSLIETLKRVPHFSHTQNTLYALAKILAKSGQAARLKSLINAVNSGNFKNVSRVCYMDQMRWYAAAQDFDSVFSVWHEWRALQKSPCTESYNIVIGLYAQSSKDHEAVDTFCRMIDEGVAPNSRTYTVVLEHLVNAGYLNSALEIFNVLPSLRVKHTLRQYLTLVDAFCGTGQFDVVKRLLYELQIDGLLPGRAMYSSLQKMHDAGYIEETSELIKEMFPDERIKYVEFSEDDNENDGDEVEEDRNIVDVDAVKLKPWFSPTVLARSLNEWRPQEVSALEDAKFVWTTRAVSKMIRNFSSTETAWRFFSWVACQPGFTHDVHTMSKMITKLARQGHINLVDQLISMLKREGIQLAFGTVKMIIDFYGISGSGGAALKVFHNVQTICGTLSETKFRLLYSSLLRTLTKCKMDSEAMNTLEEIILHGILPDIQTFSGLMNYFALQGDIKTVQRLFTMVKQSGIEPDVYMFKVVISAYCKCERASLALRVFEDMRNSNLVPDISTKRLLVKSLWREGKLREAAAVEETSAETSDLSTSTLRGCLHTVGHADLKKIHKIYCSSFMKNNDNHV